MRVGLGMLVFNRPLHTALALAYALCNKAKETDLHIFYSIHRTSQPPSKTLDVMLADIASSEVADVHYVLPNENQNCGGNVNTLMRTLSACAKYDYFVKIDDDVLIGPQVEMKMCSLLHKLEESQAMLMLMGQAVREHMRGARPFCWETEVDGFRIAQRSNRANPMETITAVSPRMLNFLKDSGKTDSCDNPKGTYIPYTKNLTAAGGKTGVVLSPAIQMQHIGLTSEIDRGSVRSWAPATEYTTGNVIKMPYFDFTAWEDAHKAGTVKEFTLRVLHDIRQAYQNVPKLSTLIHFVERYDPASDDDVPLPKDPKRYNAVKVLPRDMENADRTNGTVVRRPRTVKRVKVVNPPKPRAHRRKVNPIGAVDV